MLTRKMRNDLLHLIVCHSKSFLDLSLGKANRFAGIDRSKTRIKTIRINKVKKSEPRQLLSSGGAIKRFVFGILGFTASAALAELPMSPDANKYSVDPVVEQGWRWTRAPYPIVGAEVADAIDATCGYVAETYRHHICPKGTEISSANNQTRLEVKFWSKRRRWRPWNENGKETFNLKNFLACPVTHPIGKDTTGDGEIDKCFQLACPDEGRSALADHSSELKPSINTLLLNPIRCSTGEKVESEVIYSGRGADPLHFTSDYSSPQYDEETTLLTNVFETSAGHQRSDRHFSQLELIFLGETSKAYRVSSTYGRGRIYFGGINDTVLAAIDNRGGHLLVNETTYTQVKPDGSELVFNGQGQLISRQYANGLTRQYDYNALGQLSHVTNHYGQQLQYFYNVNHRIDKIVTPDNTEYRFEYDSLGNLSKIIYPDNTPDDMSDNTVIEYWYDNPSFPHHLTGKVNEKGIRLATWQYDTHGRAIASEHAGGIEKGTLDFSVADQTRVTHYLNDTVSNDVIYHYRKAFIGESTHKQLVKREQVACTDCVVGEWHYEYNDQGYVSQSTSPNGTITTFEYDGYGLETRRTVAAGTAEEVITDVVWDVEMNRVLSKTTGHLKTGYTYTDEGQIDVLTLTDLTTNETRITTYSYGDFGQLLSVDGPRTDVADVTSRSYHADGTIHTTKNALNQETHFDDYDASGRVDKITDANGIVTTFTYTPRGWLATSTTHGATTAYEYFATGSVKTITAPNGTSIAYEYDDGERLISVVDSLGNRMEYVRDLMGNVTETKHKDSNGVLRRSHRAVFNALGQLSQSLGNHGQLNEVTYDAEGNPLTDTNALEHTTTSSFDALNRLKESMDPDTGITKFGYDAGDRINNITDAEGQTTTYEYNAFGDLTKLTSPDTGETTFTYDEAGNRLSQTDARGVTVTYTYDALNRVVMQSYADVSENITYYYDDTTNGNHGVGRLTSVVDSSGTTDFVYDGFGNITKETRVIDGLSYITEYHFDANGQMTGMTYPSGRQLTYGFDGVGRINKLTSSHQGLTQVLATGISYLPFGPMSGLTYGNGKVLTQDFDNDYRLTDKSVTGIIGLNYGYDLTNNITSISDAENTVNDQLFAYDKLSRLSTAEGVYGDLSFTYDKIGNRLSKTENANTDQYNYTSDAHRLSSIHGASTQTFTYDAMGNLLSKGDLSFGYNQQGRLVSAVHEEMSASYLYNHKGERNSKWVNGNRTHYVYDLQGQLIAEADGNGNITNEYIYLNGQRLASVMSGQLHYVHTNHLDAPLALTDEAGEVQWQAHYTPFAQAIITIDNVTQAARFPGQYLAEETGLYYNYFRDYDPEIGRYIQSDPIGLGDGPNTYAYVRQNPIMNYDKNGLWCIPCAVGAVRLAQLGYRSYQAYRAARVTVEATTGITGAIALHEIYDDWDGDFIPDDRYGGYDPTDEAMALELANNLTGEESCVVIAEAITALENRIYGRQANIDEDHCGNGDEGHKDHIDILDKALKKLQTVLASGNCQ